MKKLSLLSIGILSLTVFSLPAFADTGHCIVNGALPDVTCTPGIALSVTKAQICVPGYSSSVRDVSTATKKQVYSEYGITSHTNGQYEVDHLISLELGGSNDIKNLWPEAASPTPGFHEKDKSLADAQKVISTNWQSVTMTTVTKSAKSSSSTKQITVVLKSSASSSSTSQCLIKGNISSKGKKFYHLPSCPSYKQTKIDTSKGEQWFCTEAEAQAAGWVKATNCH